jgi:3-hydroxybutyryl-CoA dehydratase
MEGTPMATHPATTPQPLAYTPPWRAGLEAWERAWARTAEAAWSWMSPMTLAPVRREAEAPAYPVGRTIAELAVGDNASFTKRIEQSDIDAFARVSGDANPVHIDEKWAQESFFKGRIAHGILTGGLISAAIGMQLPGPGTIYLSQTLKWLAPVRPGDELTATVTVREIVPERNRVVLDTVVMRGEDLVLTGEALVMPPKAAPATV